MLGDSAVQVSETGAFPLASFDVRVVAAALLSPFTLSTMLERPRIHDTLLRSRSVNTYWEPFGIQ